MLRAPLQGSQNKHEINAVLRGVPARVSEEINKENDKKPVSCPGKVWKIFVWNFLRAVWWEKYKKGQWGAGTGGLSGRQGRQCWIYQLIP